MIAIERLQRPCRRKVTAACFATAWRLLLLAGLIHATAGGALAASAVWELAPYRVRALVTITPAASASGVRVDALCAGIAERSTTVIGAHWSFTATAAPAAIHEMVLSDFAQVKMEAVLATTEDADVDKVMLVRVDYDERAWTIRVVDFDVRTQLFGTPAAQRVSQRVRLVDGIFQTILTAFAPIATVETVEKDVATLRLRAGAAPVRDPQLSLIRPGSIFRAAVRVNDAKGKPKRIESVDWTFLVADKIDGAHVDSRLVTGLRGPLGSRKRGRTEQLALSVRPPEATTRLDLQSADKVPRIMAGCQVFSHPVDSKKTDLLGASDPRGVFIVEPGDGGVRVLMIKSGDTIIARLPILPGMLADMTARIPDDERRLQVEGYITGFQEEFVDMIARRQVLVARIRSRIKSGKKEEAEKLIDQLRQMTAQQDFGDNLQAARQRLVSADKRTQKQIDKLFTDTQTVVNRFFDPRQVDTLERELAGRAPKGDDDDDPIPPVPPATPASNPSPADGAPATAPPTPGPPTPTPPVPAAAAAGAPPIPIVGTGQ
jgi:hypothetical protein